MKAKVRTGYVFYRKGQVYRPGEIVTDVTDDEIKNQGWKLEIIESEPKTKMLDTKTVLNRSLNKVKDK